MKKIISICLLGVVLLCCVIWCQKDNSDKTSAQSTLTQSENNIQKTSSETSFAEYTYNSPESDVGGGEIVQQKYRQCYYNISYQLSLLVDENELRTWEEETYAKDPNETNEMVVKLFVQHFNISKEDFEKANLESAKVIYDPNSPLPSMNPKDYINQEMFEIYNADIIYTFDDDIINEYYLSGDYTFVYESDFEEAVASGEYTPKTEKWIDIEEMEAEIIAKYGEAEIVTTEAKTQTELSSEPATDIPTE